MSQDSQPESEFPFEARLHALERRLTRIEGQTEGVLGFVRLYEERIDYLLEAEQRRRSTAAPPDLTALDRSVVVPRSEYDLATEQLAITMAEHERLLETLRNLLAAYESKTRGNGS